MFGDKPWEPTEMVPVCGYDNWLRYQAQSLLRVPVSLAEAKSFFEGVDVHTRMPKVTAEVLSPWQRFLTTVPNWNTR